MQTLTQMLTLTVVKYSLLKALLESYNVLKMNDRLYKY